ncbi:ifn-alpha/beta receptor glycoprotein [Volepox virus]|uniref:Ifn-alpha/beta receptor glycoprotein n=1 Tax=Volepox virus TaxID=28874 RepID=A0A1C9KC07_9POXV|nr:ifn-alpha/beta receptor glycoprotein [Volepox virus]AOP31693.1 ifn-alpha/beta receptor glycoprotein [Volepox virus]
MEIKVFAIIISIIIAVTYSFNDNAFQSALEYYESDKEELETYQRNALNESCQYGGTYPAIGVEYEALLEECSIVRDHLLSYWYENLESIEWKKIGDDHPLDHSYIKDDKLWLPMLQSKDIPEEFICTLYGNKGCVQSVVEVAKTRKKCSNENYELGMQSYITISCRVTNGYYTIDWYKDGKKIKDVTGGKYLATSNGRWLTINEVSLEDAGKYKCRGYYHDTGPDDVTVTKCIDVIIHQPQSHEFTVTVTDPILKVKLGESAKSECTAVGESKLETPYVEWQNSNGRTLPYDENVSSINDDINHATLYFAKITEEDIGKTYTCRASYYGDEKTTTTTLVIHKT